MNLYLIRHGESKGNLKGYHQGDKVPLSQKGRKQAKAVARKFKESNIKVDTLYSSPFLRAKQTAGIISEKLSLKVEYWEDLKEIKRPSELEGLAYDDSKAIEIKGVINKNKIKPDWKFSDSESYNDLLRRAKAVEEHIFKHHKDENVLCVSHMQIMAMIVFQIILQDKLSPEVFWQFFHHVRHNNSGITRFKYTKTFGWSLFSWNDTGHLE